MVPAGPLPLSSAGRRFAARPPARGDQQLFLSRQREGAREGSDGVGCGMTIVLFRGGIKRPRDKKKTGKLLSSSADILCKGRPGERASLCLES